MGELRVRHVPVFEYQPGLLAEVPAAERDRYRRGVLLPTVDIRPGPWRPPSRPAFLGMLMLSGALSRETGRFGRSFLEFLAPGDALLFAEPPVREQIRWRAALPTHLAFITSESMRTLSAIPGVAGQLWTRSERLRRRAITTSIGTSLSRVPASIYVSLWDLADRFGEHDERGISLPFALDGRELGALAATNRTTASRALAALRRAGLVEQPTPRRIILTGNRPVDEADLVLVLASMNVPA